MQVEKVAPSIMITEPLNGAKAEEGVKLVLSCGFTTSGQPVKVSWRHNGKPLPWRQEVRIDTNLSKSTLTFSKVLVLMLPYYTCI